MIKCKFVCFLVLISVFSWNCGKKKEKKAPAQNTIEYSTTLDEHAAMVKYLADAKAIYFDNPANRYASNLRADLLNAKPLPKQYRDRFELLLSTADAYLESGDTKKTIDILEKIVTDPEFDKLPKKEISKIQFLRALSLLRYGEQLNCIANHVAESCILPIAKPAFYTEKDATQKSYELFKEIIANDKNNLNAIFLLNVAAMNLGMYPDQVPAEMRIDPSKFAEDPTIPKLHNIAIDLGLDIITCSGGVCGDDFNNDGLIDIVASSWFLNDQVRFFVNNGDGTFTDHTEQANLKGITGGLNMDHADFNNDGYEDILVLRGAWWNDYGKLPNSLLKNNGDGTFTDITKSSGIWSLFPTNSAAVADYNNDGWLDIFFGNETRKDSEPYPSELYINNGDGTFLNMAKETHTDILNFVKGATATDIDNDGDMDIAVSCQGQENILLKNMLKENGGTLVFEDATKASGISGPLKSFPVLAMDYNNDGWEDIFIFTYDAGNCEYDNAAYFLDKPVHGEYSVVYKNKGNGTFENVTNAVGLNIPMTAMGLNFGDLNYDGWIDLYVGTGTPNYTSLVPNKMLLNNQGSGFRDVSSQTGMGHLQKGHGVAFADFDNDGDADVFSDMGGGYLGDAFQSAFFENTINGNAWITIDLIGVKSNRDGIGARIVVKTVYPDGSTRSIYNTMSTGGSFGSGPLIKHIGLGNASSIAELQILWPASGITQTFTNVNLNSKLQIEEGRDSIIYKPFTPFQFQKSNTHTMHNM